MEKEKENPKFAFLYDDKARPFFFRALKIFVLIKFIAS